MKKHYVGCESAVSASAKIVFWNNNSQKYDMVYFFGDYNNAIKFYEQNLAAQYRTKDELFIKREGNGGWRSTVGFTSFTTPENAVAKLVYYPTERAYHVLNYHDINDAVRAYRSAPYTYTKKLFVKDEDTNGYIQIEVEE